MNDMLAPEATRGRATAAGDILDLIDLDRPGLERVRAATSRPRGVAALAPDADAPPAVAPSEPARRNAALPDGGFYVFRSDWTRDAVWMAVQCAPDGGWHAHGDDNSFELFAFGRYLMPDTGMPIYHGDAERRRWSRATRHHQCLTLDGADAALAPRLRFWQDGDDCAAVCVENASYPGLVHRRTVAFVRRRFFVVVDEALGDAPDACAIHFQLGPPAATIAGDDLALEDGDVRLRVSPLTPHAPVAEEGRVAFRYLDHIRAPPSPTRCATASRSRR